MAGRRPDAHEGARRSARPVIEEANERWPMDARFARPLAMLYATFGKGVDAVRLLDQTLAAATAISRAVQVRRVDLQHPPRGVVVHDPRRGSRGWRTRTRTRYPEERVGRTSR